MVDTVRIRVKGLEETKRALDRLGRESPARARSAVNRTLGVARKRVIRTVAKLVGIPQKIIGGKQTRRNRKTGVRSKGTGYIKMLKARRNRAIGALVGLVQGVRLSKLPPGTQTRAVNKLGGSRPFRAKMPTGHQDTWTRVPPSLRRSKGAWSKNLPIVRSISLEPHASRAIKTHMARAARSVLPAKIWEELQKSIRRRR